MIRTIKDKIKTNFQGEFTQNVIKLVTGTAISQFLVIISTPLLTRIFSPADFGIYGLFASISGIFIVILNAGYEQAILLPEKEEDAINLLAFSAAFSVAFSLLIFLIIILFNSLLTSMIGIKDFQLLLYLIPISNIVKGFNQSQIYWCNRKKQFARISKNRIMAAIVLTFFSLLFGYLKYKAYGLIFAFILSDIISSLFLLYSFCKEDFAKLKFISIKNMITQIKQFSAFPKYNIWSSFINSFSLNLPTIMFSGLFNPSVAGYYSASYKFITMPVSLVAGSFSQVFFQKASEERNNPVNIEKLSYETYKKLLSIGIIPFSIILGFGDLIFSYALGSKWLIAGQYSQILSVFFLLILVSSPLSYLFPALYKPKPGFIWSIILLLSRVIPIFIGYYVFNNPFLTVVLFGLSCTLIRFTFCLYLLRMVGIKITESLTYTLSRVLPVLLFVYIIRLMFFR
ncbi:MAG: oligosaccharide flippase family protein [bacterium]